MHKLISTALFALIAPLCSAAAPAKPAEPAPGQAGYESKCAACHGKTGQGNASMARLYKITTADLSLVSAEAASETPEEFIKAISEGKGKMPAFKDKLQPSEIAEIAAYVRAMPKALGGAGAKPSELDEAKKLYAAKCSSCHGKDGKGNAALAKGMKIPPAGLDLVKAATADKKDEELLAVMQKGEGKMPAYADKLSAKDLEALLRYMRSLAPKKAK